MSGAAGVPPRSRSRAHGRRLAPLFRDQPLVPLLVLLGRPRRRSIALLRPGILGADWAGVIVRPPIPLAILAGCQTLTLLTGGIDLSVGAVASMTGFLVATLVGGQGCGRRVAVALLVAALAGLLTGIGVGVFRVHPLIMTLGMGLVVLGLRQRRGSSSWSRPAAACRPSSAGLGSRRRCSGIVPGEPARVRAARRVHPVRPPAHGLRPPAVRHRRQPDRGPPLGRAVVAGAAWPCTCSRRCMAAIAGFLLLGPQQHRAA